MLANEFHKKTAPMTITYTRTELLIIAALIISFTGTILWFDWIDFYHQHFFETGVLVIVDNIARILFVAILSWLIYVPGAGIATLIMSSSEKAKLTLAERAVVGFGIGVGIWHVVMLILGVLGLYYRLVMVGMCLIVLVASARHFANIAIVGWRATAIRFSDLRQRHALPQTIGAAMIAVVAAWLLLRRGLYPGGGGDYYTHYFYYYLEVLKNHG